MAETLGSLCDKLTIVKLKLFHADSPEKKARLEEQQTQLVDEMDAFFSDAVSGRLPPGRLTFHANKVYQKEGNTLDAVPTDSIGKAFAELAKANCELWHVQEKVYFFEKVPVDQKDAVVKQLALLNLRRVQCVDAIDDCLLKLVTHR